MPVRVTAKVYGAKEVAAKLRIMSEQWVAAPRALAHVAGKIVEETLKEYAPSGQGLPHEPNLRESIGFTLSNIGSGYTARFYANPYAQWVLEGRGAITRGPGQGPLHFFIDGEEIFTRHVKKAEPNDFRRKAMEQARPEIEALMHEAGIRTVRGELWTTSTVWG